MKYNQINLPVIGIYSFPHNSKLGILENVIWNQVEPEGVTPRLVDAVATEWIYAKLLVPPPSWIRESLEEYEQWIAEDMPAWVGHVFDAWPVIVSFEHEGQSVTKTATMVVTTDDVKFFISKR